MYREFVVPSDDQWMYEFGIEVALDEETRTIRYCTGDGADIVLSYDAVGRSIRVEAVRDGCLVADIFRESAVRLEILSESSGLTVLINFETEELSGKLIVKTHPAFTVKDTMLLH